MNEDQNSPWEYKPDGAETPKESPEGPADSSPAPSRKANASVSWQAAEFIEHPHPPSWYAALFIAAFLLAAVVYLIAKDVIAASTIIIVGVIVGIFAGHKPNQVEYGLDDSGISVNGKHYPYSSFKSFAVLREGSLNSVNLFPIKRFMPPVSAYFDPKDEEKITNALGNYLPYEDRKMDGIDRLSRRLRL
jgi:hypothetical protein